MKQSALIPLAAAVLLGATGSALGLNVGEKAPALEIQEWVKGEPLDLTSAEGKIVLLEFWASW